MDDAVGTWEFDIGTGRLTADPREVMPPGIRLPEGGAEIADLRSRLHPDDATGLEQAIADFMAGRSPALRCRFRAGSERDGWVFVEISGRRDKDGRGLSGVWADVTESEVRLARKSEAVSRVHQFAAAASHDLIGPLRHIAMYGELLLGDFGTGATQEKRQMIEAITEKARNLQILTKRVIAFSTATAAPEFVAVPLDRVIRDVRQRLAAEIDVAEATFRVGPLPVVLGDPVLIEKAFENLLRNALEWRSERPLEIGIEGRPEGRSAVIDVSDNGSGIDERYAGRVFDAFWSLPRAGGEKGAGLGLAVCKTVLTALDGAIDLRSSSPEGSAFEVTLPLWR